MNRATALELAKKLRALAERSDAGEQSAARKKLIEFCTRHGLDVDDFSFDLVRVSVKFTNEQERTMLSSIMCMILEVDAVKGRVVENEMQFQCTQPQFDDIIDAFNYYKKMYYDYVDGIVAAIVVRHEIRNKKPAAVEFKMDPMTEEEQAEYDSFLKEHQPKVEPVEKSTESLPPTPVDVQAEQQREAEKRDRLSRMVTVMESRPWTKKVRAKLFLD